MNAPGLWIRRTPRLALRPISLIVATIIIGQISVWAQQSAATFSGRLTDQNTGQGITDAAIVIQGNQTGTRVAISDAQGNYTLTVGANTNVRLRAYKSQYVFNPAAVGFTSIGGTITGSHPLDFAGTTLPFLIFVQPPILLTEDDSLRALVLDSLSHQRDPFPLLNNNYFGTDKRTRIKLFLVDLELRSGESIAIVTAQARDVQQRVFDLPVEDLRKVPGFPWLSQLIVLLPNDLPAAGELSLTVSARGQVSNAATMRIQ
jgi:hypothetical protein